MFGFDKKELDILSKLNRPSKIQDFIDDLETNFENQGETCMSPKKVLNNNKAHCMEGAMLAAAALRVNGYPPLVVDMTAYKKDFDHVIAVFKEEGHWGAISKTNHAVLKYRDPIFRSVRELVISYFNEYFLNDGNKTLRSYTRPINLSRFDKFNWMASDEDIWFIPEFLATTKHIELLTRKQIKNLRKSDPIEIEAGKIADWNIKNGRTSRNVFKYDKNAVAEI
ncbi:MAG: hypothetical protein AABY22_35290 [Nanoarchaeota archaeon]